MGDHPEGIQVIINCVNQCESAKGQGGKARPPLPVHPQRQSPPSLWTHLGEHIELGLGQLGHGHFKLGPHGHVILRQHDNSTAGRGGGKGGS